MSSRTADRLRDSVSDMKAVFDGFALESQDFRGFSFSKRNL